MAVWSPEQIQILKDYAAAGASRMRIAARLNRTAGAVTREAKKHGIELKKAKQVRAEFGLSRRWANNREY